SAAAVLSPNATVRLDARLFGVVISFRTHARRTCSRRSSSSTSCHWSPSSSPWRSAVPSATSTMRRARAHHADSSGVRTASSRNAASNSCSLRITVAGDAVAGPLEAGVLAGVHVQQVAGAGPLVAVGTSSSRLALFSGRATLDADGLHDPHLHREEKAWLPP